jgi:hypothetical protein
MSSVVGDICTSDYTPERCGYKATGLLFPPCFYRIEKDFYWSGLETAQSESGGAILPSYEFCKSRSSAAVSKGPGIIIEVGGEMATASVEANF